MATLETSIQLNDFVSSTLNNIGNMLTSTVRQFESVQSVVAQNADTAMFNNISAGANSAIQAVEELDNTAHNAVNWISSQDIELFGGGASERFTKELQSVDNMMQQLTMRQGMIAAQAENVNILPPNALDDINGLNARMQALDSQIQSVLQSRIEIVGVDRANAEVEQLREHLNAALSVQEDMNVALQNMDASSANRAYLQLNNIVTNTERNIRDNINEQQRFTEEVNRSASAGSGLKKILGAVGIAFSVRAGINFVRQSIGLTHQQIRAEQQLANVISNRGGTYEDFLSLQAAAMDIQNRTTIDDTAILGAANELARHVSDTDAIEIMMSSLADFAAGVGNVFGATAQDMVGYAQYFTHAMQGNYRQLERRAGVYLTEIQREIIQNGNDMQRALVIQEVVSQSWEELAEQMAQTPEGMRASMLNTFADIRQAFGTQLIPVVMQLFQTIQANMPQIEQLFMGLARVVQFIVSVMSVLLRVALSVSDVIINNWSWIEPIAWGIVGALIAWKIAQVDLNKETLLGKRLLAAKKIAIGLATFLKNVMTVGIWKAVAALVGLKMALIKTGIGAIIVAIGVVIALIARWVQSVGGLRIAWMIVMNVLRTAWDNFKIGFMIGVFAVMNFLDRMSLKFSSVRMAITNFMGDMRANVLNILQNLVNRAIGIINGLIERLNRIPGVNIRTIEEVTFGAQAAAQNEAERQARSSALEDRRAQVENNAAKCAATLDQMRYERDANRANRLADIATAQYAAADSGGAFSLTDFVQMDFDNDALGDIANNAAAIAGNTGNMANISEENLKYWRDIAERDAINRFTTAKVNVNFRGGIHNNVNNDMDLDGIIDYLSDGVEEALEITAEQVVYA